MKKTVFMDKYPIYSIELQKSEMKLTSAKDVAAYFIEKIQNHPIAKIIALFDHYSHTKELNGQIMDGLIDAQNIVFCFGQAIPNTKMLALRPRSIAVCEFEDKIVIDFLEAPKEEIHQLMQKWTIELKK